MVFLKYLSAILLTTIDLKYSMLELAAHLRMCIFIWKFVEQPLHL